jgi:hypothetical protein
MQAFLAAFKIAMQLLPLLGAIIKVVEQMVPQSGQGIHKLEMVRTMIENAYGKIDGAAATFDQVWPLLEPAIAGLVKLYKQTGVFQPPPPPAPPDHHSV